MTCWWNWLEGGGNVRIQAIIETAIYVDDLRAAETFSRTVRGLRGASTNIVSAGW